MQYADPHRGNYYVSVFDPSSNAGHGRLGLLLGPFGSHQEALDRVAPARTFVEAKYRWADFWSFGTVRMADDFMKPGRLNAVLPDLAPQGGIE